MDEHTLYDDDSTPAAESNGAVDVAGDSNDPFGAFDTTDKPVNPISFDDFDPFATIQQEPTPTSPEKKSTLPSSDLLDIGEGDQPIQQTDTPAVDLDIGGGSDHTAGDHTGGDLFGDFGEEPVAASTEHSVDLLGGGDTSETSQQLFDPFGQEPFGQESSTDTDLFQHQQANPFADQSDPFGTHSDPFGHQSDPFAQQEDPFAPSAVEEPVAASQEPAESTTVREGSQSEQPRGSQSEDLRRGSEIDDDLIEDIECHHGIPIKEQLELEQGSQEEEPDLLKESDSWDDIQGITGAEASQNTEPQSQDLLYSEDYQQVQEAAAVEQPQESSELESEGLEKESEALEQESEGLEQEQAVSEDYPGSSINTEDYLIKQDQDNSVVVSTDMSNMDIAAEFDDLMGGFGDKDAPQEAPQEDQVVTNGSAPDVNGVEEQSLYDDQQMSLHTNGVQKDESYSRQILEEGQLIDLSDATSPSAASAPKSNVWPPESPNERLKTRLQAKQLQQQEEVKTEPQKGGKDDKKAMEYMKERYEDTGEKGHTKIIRQPKKLDNKWEKMGDEELQSPTDKDMRHALPKEQDLVSYTAIPIDYSKSKYQEKVDKDQIDPQLIDPKIPVNRRPPPVKVAPPAITQNLKSLFESGEFTDLHKAHKKEIHINRKGSGVHENEPVPLEGVIRESDFDEDSESVERGITNNLIEEWKMKGKDDKKKKVVKKPISINKEGKGPAVLENDPKVRKDVVRETDENDKLPDSGVADKAKQQLEEKTAAEEPKAKEPIDLPPARPGTVFENEPVVRDDVIREEDSDTTAVNIETGKAKNLAGFWANQSDEVKLEKKTIVIDRDSTPAVLENEPVVLDGVVRSSDQDTSETAIDLEEGRTKNLAGYWKNKMTDDEKPIKPKEPIKLDVAETTSAGIVENEPAVREDVVKCGEVNEDVIPGDPGRTKKMASMFLATEDDSRKGPKEMIHIDRSVGVVVTENEPVTLDDGVVRSAPEDGTVDLEGGHTKNLLNHWVKQEEDAAAPKTSTSKVALENKEPLWVAENTDAAKDSGVYENEPEQRDNVSRETDILEAPDMLQEDHTKTLRNRWKQMEANAQDEKNAPPQLVRFTPPREMTPPNVYQTDYQSFQQITLCQPNSPTEEQSFNHTQGVDSENSMNNGLHIQQPEQPYSNMNGHADTVGDSCVPVTPVKSSAVLVLK